jgi:hypothetical protein
MRMFYARNRMAKLLEEAESIEIGCEHEMREVLALRNYTA